MKKEDGLLTVFYYIDMKYIITISIISSLLSPFNTPVRNYGGTMTEFSYNYVYIVDYYESTQVASSGAYQYEHDYPTYYGIKVNIVFKQPIKSARLTMTLTTPNTTSAYWESIGENCYITRNNSTTYYVDCYNCSNATFVMLMSYEDVKSEYGYNRLSWNSVLESVNTWIEYGSQYCDLRGLQVSSNYVIDTEPNYTTQLNTLLSQTDSIENYLLQIWNNAITANTTLSNISSTLSSISSYIQAINNKIDSLNSIKWNDINTTYRGFTTDFDSYDLRYGVTEPAGYYVYDSFYANPANPGLYRIEIPIGNTQLNYSNIKLYTLYNNTIEGHQIIPDNYLFFANRSSIVIYFNVNDTYSPWPNGENPLVVYVNKSAFYYSYPHKMQYILQSDVNYWTIYNSLKQISSLNNINASLSDIIAILGDINLSQNDITEYREVDQYVDNLVENIVFPDIPQAPDGYLERLQIILDPVKDIFASSDLTYFRWIYSILAIFTIFKLVVK